MAIAFDVATVAAAYALTGSQTTSHVASASARAAVVLIEQNTVATDQVTAVTYGGVAMTKVTSISEATEAGLVSIWWLDAVPTGTQNVVMTTNGTAPKQLVVATMTAAAGTKIVVAGQNSGSSASVANPAWTITGLTATSVLEAFEVIHSGLTTMTATPAAGWTLISQTDLGAQGRGFARRHVASSGTSLASGWTAGTADDFAGASVAFLEVVVPLPHTLGGGTLSAWINAADLPGADGSSITSITESSPTARVLNVVSGTAPVLRKTAGPNGQPIIDHTGAAGGLHSATGGASTPGGDLTYFAVVKRSSAASQSLMMGQTWYTPDLQITATNHVALNSNAVVGLGESANALISGWSIVVVAFTAGTKSTHFDLDDITNDSNIGGAQTFYTDQGVSYGEDFANGTFTGQVAEVGLYGSVLSGTDITTLKNYLKTKYALPVIVLTPPDPPVVDVGDERIMATTPPTLPGTSTSFSLYENGVKIAGLLAIDEMYQCTPRDANVVYSYTLRGDGPAGETGDSTAVVGTPNPSTFTGLTAVGGAGQITLNWNPKSYTGTVYAWLYRDGSQQFYGPNTNTYVDTGLADGSTHVYKIKSVVFNPTGRSSAFSADVGAVTNSPVVVRNPDLVFDVGGPSYSTNREDMLDDPRATIHQRCLRTTDVAWSAAERLFSALELLPPQWLDTMAGPSRSVNYFGVPGQDLGCRLYFENGGVGIVGPRSNFVEGPAGPDPLAYWWWTPYGDSAIWYKATWPDTEEHTLLHEITHHFNHIVRPALGLDILIAGAPTSAGLTLANEFVAAVIAVDPGQTGLNVDEMVSECYPALMVANADPSHLLAPPSATFPAGIRADQYFTTVCGDADLAARWIAELTPPEIWPAAPWPVSRTMTTQAKVDAHRNAIAMPIQNLDSNEGPTLLLADATKGYRAATDPADTYLTTWGRSDRPLPIATNSLMRVIAGAPTAEVTNGYVSAGLNAVPTVQLLAEPSEKWRVTVTFRVGEIPAGTSILWHAIETSVTNIETEYALTWNGASVSATLTRRTGTGGTVIDTTTIASGNILVAGERCTVQGIWLAQGANIVLRHRTASAGSVTTLTSVATMPTRLAVKSWSMPMPHNSNGPTVSYCALAAVSVETIFLGGADVGPMTWMDAEYA